MYDAVSIDGEGGTTYFAFDGSLTTLDVASNTKSVTIVDGVITTTDCDFYFVINSDGTTIQSNSGYYIGNTSNSNALSSSKTTAYTNSLSIDTDANANANAVIKSSGGAYLRYNSAKDQLRFRYYKSSSYASQKAIALYKKQASDSTTVEAVTVDHAFDEIEIGKTITVDCKTEGAVLNGNIGNNVIITNESFPYTYTIQESDLNTTLHCVFEASKEGMTSSKLVGTYIVVAPTPAAPVFSIEGGYVDAGTVVTVTYEDVDGATLQLYAGENAVEGTSYTVNETVTLKAVVTNKYGKTAEATVTYMVASPFMVSDILTVSDTKANGTSYVKFEGVKKNGAEYAGKNAKSTDNESTCIQLGYNENTAKGAYGSEIVMTKSIGTVSRIIITWSTSGWPNKTEKRGVEIFGKQQPYKAGGAQLMEEAVCGWNIATLLYDNRDANNQTIYDVQYELNGENVPIYYIGIRPTSDGAVYIESIEYIWNDSFEGGAETTYSLAASVSENNFVVLATDNVAVSREDASKGETVEFDENSIALSKGQTTVDEFQVVNSYTQGGVTYFNLYGGVENLSVNNRHYLAEATFVTDENSASLFYMDVDGYLRYADDNNSYYVYNGTSFAKSTDSTGAVKVYSNTTGKTTDVEAVEIEDADAPVEYYNLQGVRVANPQCGLYIVRQGNKVSKQIIR